MARHRSHSIEFKRQVAQEFHLSGLRGALQSGVNFGRRLTTETPQARRGSKIDWTSAAKDALLWVPADGHGHPVKHLGLASRCAGLWVVRASIPAPRTNGAQTMSTLSIKSRNTKSAAPKKGSGQSKTASRRKVTSLLPTPRNRRDLLNRRPSESPPPRRR
jgi:hypothetical protein